MTHIPGWAGLGWHTGEGVGLALILGESAGWEGKGGGGGHDKTR